MKKKKNGLLVLFLLLIPSAGLYITHYILFKDSVYLWKDFLSQLAFLPLYYFFTSILIDNLLVRREKQKIHKNIHMLIGVFFSDFGNEFISHCAKFDKNYEDYSRIFHLNANWKDSQYNQALQRTKTYPYRLDMHKSDLEEFRNFLMQRRNCLITILENGNLIEHDTFTDLLLAIFHLCEEFKYRDNFVDFTASDYEHLAVDTIRAYSLIGYEWLNYSRHLRDEYPHLYSLSIGFNPFKRMVC